MKSNKIVDSIACIYDRNPELKNICWTDIFNNDTTVLNNIIAYAIKLSHVDGGSNSHARWELLQGYGSADQFNQTFSRIIGDDSLRVVGTKIGVSHQTVRMLINGTTFPSIDLIEKIASIYGIHPSYFLEYREYIILSAFKEFLRDNPEVSYSIFQRITNGDSNSD